MRSKSDFKSEQRSDKRRKKMGFTSKAGMVAQHNNRRKSAIAAQGLLETK